LGIGDSTFATHSTGGKRYFMNTKARRMLIVAAVFGGLAYSIDWFGLLSLGLILLSIWAFILGMLVFLVWQLLYRVRFLRFVPSKSLVWRRTNETASAGDLPSCQGGTRTDLKERVQSSNPPGTRWTPSPSMLRR
jgi:hypothetical protein